jgi:hypothetical protein
MPDSRLLANPFRQRLRAWWEGYDLTELKRLLARAANEDSVPEAPRVTVPPARASAPATRPAEPVGWTPDLITASQIVWGEGSLSPRGDSQLRALSARAGLGARSRVLHLGAELGGIAALIEHGIGCKVVAAETLKPLVDASAGQVTQVRPADSALLADADFILVDGLSERGDPLAAILRNQCASLAPGGLVVVRSLVIADERHAGSARFRDWAAREPVRPRLRSVEELSRVLQEARLAVIVTSDISTDYAAEVEHSWGDAVDRIRALHREADGQKLIPVLLAEGERWLKRIELIREGAIGVRLLIATRRDHARR